jgi:hypothetical protein
VSAGAVGGHCVACGEPLAARQRWCLGCGAGARTMIAATPRWTLRAGAGLGVALIALVGVGLAIAALAGA